MFEKFKELFSSQNLLETAFETTLTMLEFDSKMFEASRHTLRESDNAELPFDIKEMDRKVNKYEREVRRNVLTHLTVAGTANLVPGLVLVSIVVDVERIGDFTKNIVELAQQHTDRLHGDVYEESLSAIESRVQERFGLTYKVLKNQDKEMGRSIMQAEDETGKQADSIMNSLISCRDDGIKSCDSVALALYARYLKRINAHLTNVASAIVNPFPRISFREKKPK